MKKDLPKYYELRYQALNSDVGVILGKGFMKSSYSWQVTIIQEGARWDQEGDVGGIFMWTQSEISDQKL